MDLFSQAEHDELAQSILLCPDADYIERVQQEIDRLLPEMPRADIIAKSLNGRGALIHTRSLEEACAISNRIAPEHLEIASSDPHRWEPLLHHAGRSSWARTRARRWATTARVPTTCCPPAPRPASPARWASTTSRNAAA
jgi:histidinol dehydrogenase